MNEPDDRSKKARLAKALEGLDMGRVYAQVVAYASKKADTREMAREFAQKYLVEAIDPETSLWDPDALPLVVYVIGRVRGGLAAARRANKLRTEDRLVVEVKQRVVRTVPGPDRMLQANARRAGILAILREVRESFEAEAASEFVLSVMDQYEAGTMKAGEQAAALGADMDDVYVARRAIKRRAAAIRARKAHEAGDDFVARAMDPEEYLGAGEDEADPDEAADE
jgi:hypothetical protein